MSMRRFFIPTLVAAICAVGALAPEALARKSGLSITNVTGWSDGPSNGECDFHAVVTYTGKPAHGDVTAAFLLTTTSDIASTIGAPPPVGRSGFTLGPMSGDPIGNLPTTGLYFLVQVENKSGTVVASYQTQNFSLNTANFVNGCPETTSALVSS
jgi:hypothetical protein